jgi:hypothetical protein
VESKQISKLPYDQRRMIVVRDAEAADRRRPRGLKTAALAVGAMGSVTGIVIAATIMEKMMERSSLVKGELLVITNSEATALRFPVGHPRRKVVYVGHPIDPVTYIPMAYFHTFLFEHKVAEALRLMRSLGADSVDVVRVEGWDRSAGIALSAPLPGAEQVQVGASVGFERGQGHSVMTRMRLKPQGPPCVPDNLVWLPHEPLWQEVVDARVASGLRSFVLDVRSFDDYGVNASLKALVAKSGLEAGGAFVEHRATLWRIEGTFAS